jgi:glutathione peroxidase-family protein
VQGAGLCDHRHPGKQFWGTGAWNQSGNEDLLPVQIQCDFSDDVQSFRKGRRQNAAVSYLTDKSANPKTGGDIQWNFTKFLAGPDGQIITRFEPAVTPNSPEVTEAIEKALAAAKR